MQGLKHILEVKLNINQLKLAVDIFVNDSRDQLNDQPTLYHYHASHLLITITISITKINPRESGNLEYCIYPVLLNFV